MLFPTPPLTIIDHPADSHHCGGLRINPPKYIYLHASGGTNSLRWLSTDSPPTNPVSCHRLISKQGTIYKIVPDNINAWTQGYGIIGGRNAHAQNLNIDGLSIELENLDNFKDNYPPEQIRSCAMQVVEWWGAYGFLPILSHAAVDPRKHDPAGFPWASFHAEIGRQFANVYLYTQWKAA
jgi:N-acetyl-anhydromuramyl-L-alanine amidase AmpD